MTIEFDYVKYQEKNDPIHVSLDLIDETILNINNKSLSVHVEKGVFGNTCSIYKIVNMKKNDYYVNIVGENKVEFNLDYIVSEIKTLG